MKHWENMDAFCSREGISKSWVALVIGNGIAPECFVKYEGDNILLHEDLSDALLLSATLSEFEDIDFLESIQSIMDVAKKRLAKAAEEKSN